MTLRAAGGWGWSCVGGIRNSNTEGTTYWYRIKNLILGKEPNAHLASAPGLELQHLIMSMLGGHGGRLEREIERENIFTGRSTLGVSKLLKGDPWIFLYL